MISSCGLTPPSSTSHTRKPFSVGHRVLQARPFDAAEVGADHEREPLHPGVGRYRARRQREERERREDDTRAHSDTEIRHGLPLSEPRRWIDRVLAESEGCPEELGKLVSRPVAPRP